MGKTQLRCSNVDCELRQRPAYEWTFHVTLVVYGDWDTGSDHVPVCLDIDHPSGGSDVRTECFKCTHCGSRAEEFDWDYIAAEAERDELVAALKACIDEMHKGLEPDYTPEALTQAREAVAKAEGGE